MLFKLETGEEIPAVTTEQMREVDLIAVEDFGYDILQEHAYIFQTGS